MTDLGTLRGTRAAAPLVSMITVKSLDFQLQTSGQCHAFLYSGGTMTDLGTLGGNRQLRQWYQ